VGLNVFHSAPGATTLLSPPDGAVDTEITPLLEWSAGTQSSDFVVEVATDIDFTNVVFSATVGTESVVATGLEPLSTYFWRVQAMNPCGSGEYSATWSFTTKDVPPVLLVDDDDNSPDVRAYYTEVLDHMSIDYDIWDTNNSDDEPSEFDLAPYSTVIWFTGDEFGGYAGPGSAGESALAAWLDSARAFQANRCFVISSQDYIWDRGITSFMTGYLGIADGESDVGQTEVTGRGPIGTWNLVYPFTNYSDRLYPGNGGVWFYHGNQGTAGTAKITDTYATAFLGFPLEALPHPRPRGQTLLFFLRTCNSLP
jgi:hypothetical protein